MAKSKKHITSYEQLRERIGAQNMPSMAEVKIMREVFNQEMEQRNGELTWAIMLVYIAGKVKGSGIVTHNDLDIIVKDMLQKKEKASTTANSEGLRVIS
ncbi:hypothetical protein [Bacillus infantis]|uniref:hypothetical protein n=1 Tax=Bacillus infantis TaxID=324767 RepID=UPI003CF7075E